MRGRLVVLLVVLVSACATVSNVAPSTHRASAAAVLPAQRFDVWQRAVAVLLEDGYIPELLNESAAFIRARKADNSNFATFVIAPDGQARLEISGAVTTGFFQDPIVELTKRQAALLESIIHPPSPVPHRDS